MSDLIMSLPLHQRVAAMWFVLASPCECLSCCRWRHVMHSVHWRGGMGHV